MPNLSNFVHSFTQELSRSYLFDVVIVPPTAVSSNTGISTQLTLRCESTFLPAKSFATHDLNIYGPKEMYPNQLVFDTLALVFICSGDMTEKILFDKWMELINPSSSYNFNYKEQYAKDIKIRQYDLLGNVTYTVTLKDAFPISMSAMNLDWGSQDINKLTVEFVFTSWSSESSSSGSTDQSNNSFNSNSNAPNLGINGVATDKPVGIGATDTANDLNASALDGAGIFI